MKEPEVAPAAIWIDEGSVTAVVLDASDTLIALGAAVESVT